ncbi:MAG: hypothetical protein IPH37_16775 [Burkholderiales bacterium]|nr:hypothetical protein [Burkholderiales bacterium]
MVDAGTQVVTPVLMEEMWTMIETGSIHASASQLNTQQATSVTLFSILFRETKSPNEAKGCSWIFWTGFAPTWHYQRTLSGKNFEKLPERYAVIGLTTAAFVKKIASRYLVNDLVREVFRTQASAMAHTGAFDTIWNLAPNVGWNCRRGGECIGEASIVRTVHVFAGFINTTWYFQNVRKVSSPDPNGPANSSTPC